MIVQNNHSLQDNPVNPPATTRQPSGLTPGTALACASGLPVAGIDLAAADAGAAAADLADAIAPNGSTKGRNALADALTRPEPRTVTLEAWSFSRDRATGRVKCEKGYPHGLTYGDRMTFEGQRYVVCDIDDSSAYWTYIDVRNLDFKPVADLKGNLTFTVGGVL